MRKMPGILFAGISIIVLSGCSLPAIPFINPATPQPTAISEVTAQPTAISTAAPPGMGCRIRAAMVAAKIPNSLQPSGFTAAGLGKINTMPR